MRHIEYPDEINAAADPLTDDQDVRATSTSPLLVTLKTYLDLHLRYGSDL